MNIRGTSNRRQTRDLQFVEEEHTHVQNENRSSTVFADENEKDRSWLNTWDEGRWACGGYRPEVEDVTRRSSNIPVCLRVRQVNYGGGSSDVYSLPSVPLCLMDDITMEKPPIYCYDNDQTGVGPVYLWWSPCDECGTAWRIFRARDNDQSWFKLPADNGQIPSNTERWEWLGWDGDEWIQSPLAIRECENPRMECIVKESVPPVAGTSNWTNQNYRGEIGSNDGQRSGDGNEDGKVIAILVLMALCIPIPSILITIFLRPLLRKSGCPEYGIGARSREGGDNGRGEECDARAGL